MNKLLSAGFLRIVRGKPFLICSAFMLLLGVGLQLIRYFDMKSSGYINELDDAFFAFAALVGVLVAVVCSLFIGTEYSDGTMRNKIIAGHTRAAIYLSNLLVCSAAAVLLCLAYIVPSLAVGIPLLGTFSNGSAAVFLVFCSLGLTLSFTAIFTLISMLSQSKSTSAVVCIICSLVLIFIGVYANSRLNEPKYYDSYSYVLNGEAVMQGSELNHNYLDGTRRDICEFILDFEPGGQAVQVSMSTPERPARLLPCSLAIFILSSACGIVIFRKKDLR